MKSQWPFTFPPIYVLKLNHFRNSVLYLQNFKTWRKLTRPKQWNWMQTKQDASRNAHHEFPWQLCHTKHDLNGGSCLKPIKNYWTPSWNWAWQWKGHNDLNGNIQIGFEYRMPEWKQVLFTRNKYTNIAYNTNNRQRTVLKWLVNT